MSVTVVEVEDFCKLARRIIDADGKLTLQELASLWDDVRNIPGVRAAIQEAFQKMEEGRYP